MVMVIIISFVPIFLHMTNSRFDSLHGSPFAFTSLLHLSYSTFIFSIFFFPPSSPSLSFSIPALPLPYL